MHLFDTMFGKFALAMLVCLSAALAQPSHAGTLKVLVRYDDYSSLSNTEFERKLLSGIERLGGGVLVSVIPFPGAAYPKAEADAPSEIDLDDAKISLLRGHVLRGSAAIAVHGYSHRNNATGARQSEMQALPEAQQRRLLAVGRDAMQRSFGMPIDTFVPAFNAYDDKSVNALVDAGYKTLSAGEPIEPQSSGTLDSLPAGTYAQRLKEVVLAALGKGQTEGLVVAVIHGYDIVGVGEGLPAFRGNSAKISLDRVLGDLRDLARDPRVKLVSMAALQGQGEDLSAARLRANVELRTNFIVRYRLLPEWLGLLPLDGLYYTQHDAAALRARQLGAFVMLYLGLLVLVACLTYAIGRHAPFRLRPMVVPTEAASAAMVLALAVKSQLGGLYMTSALLLVGAIGILLGIASEKFRRRRQAPSASTGSPRFRAGVPPDPPNPRPVPRPTSDHRT